MITKEQVLQALLLIDRYKIQEQISVNELINKTNRETDKRSIVCLGLKTRELNCFKGIVMINKALKDDGIVTEDFVTW